MRFFRLSLFALALIASCGGKTSESTETSDTGSNPIDSVAIDSRESPPDEGMPDMEPPPPDTPMPTATDKVDVLFVVDNSISMADKQAELGRAIPGMIRDLTTATATTKAFTSVHVGVITSSLGSHGTSACAVEITSAASNDKAHLMPRDGSCSGVVASSALSWTFADGADAATKLGTQAACVVQSAKENGCGYEETLEAMYRFLMDPAPYARAEVKCTFGVSGDACGSNKIVVEGTDTEVLTQRSTFLRPDSTVVIVVLSDENDFSLKPAGLNWLPWGYGKGQMQPGWASCKGVPDDFEPETAADFSKLHTEYKCFSCFEDASDPGCKVAWATSPLNNDVDGRNLRGFHQVQRFGYNFLWGRDRYVAGLTKPMVMGSDGKVGTNGLFAGGRSPANVIFAPLVGVPTKLVNTSDGLPKMLTSESWDKIVGALAVRDPHMIESIAPRAGVPKYAGDRTVDPTNGGDRDITDGDDLQYACIAKRTATTGGNDCFGPSPATRSPLCDTSSAQTYFKAYPGLRHLRVARDVNGFVGSICDPNLGDVLRVLVNRVRPTIK